MLILASDGSRSKRMVNCSVILNYCQINLTKRMCFVMSMVVCVLGNMGYGRVFLVSFSFL